MDYYIHQTPGRLRLQTPFIHHNEANAHTLCEYLKGITGVTSLECQPLTGSIIIHYDPNGVTWEKIVSMLEQKSWFKLSEAKSSDEVIKEESEKVIDAAVKIAETVEGGME